MNSGELATCPFCGYTSSDTYTLIHHVEVLHPENGQSPFAAVDDDCPNGANKPTINNGEPVPESNAEVSLSAEDAVAEDMYYLDCPVGCGEKILPDDLSLHLDLHFAESAAFEEVGLTDLAKEHVNKGHGDYVTDAGLEVAKKMAEDFSAYEGDFTVAGKGSRKHHRRRHSESSRSSKKSTSSQSSGKFSKAELGPHANERRMPQALFKQLQDEAKITRVNTIRPDGTIVAVEKIPNQTAGLIPVLTQLSGSDPTVRCTYLCNPMVRHVFKKPNEGGFCGYRNIQSLITYIRDARAFGHDHFPDRVATIPELQDMIEQAWNMGFNTASRALIGNIKGTRKYIGTSEAQALFQSLNIACTPAGFADVRGRHGYEKRGYEDLLGAVSRYFKAGPESRGVVQTTLPPIYLQHRGHSLTIIGLEIYNNNSMALLVFDPALLRSPGAEYVGKSTRTCSDRERARILKAYRRGKEYLQHFKEYEILTLAPTAFPDDSPGALTNNNKNKNNNNNLTG